MKYAAENVHTVIGGMVGDRLQLWCKACGEEIDHVRFHHEDSRGVQLAGDCPTCRKSFVFKMTIAPALQATASSGKT